MVTRTQGKPGPHVAGLQALLSPRSGCGTWWVVGLGRKRGRKAGEKWLNLGLPAIAGAQTPMRATKGVRGPDPTSQQPALLGGPPPAQTPQQALGRLSQSPQPCGRFYYSFYQRRGNTKGEKELAQVTQPASGMWTTQHRRLGLRVGRQWDGLETVPDCRAQAHVTG